MRAHAADRALTVKRPHLELYIRKMQEIRRFKPSAVSRRVSLPPGSAGPASSSTHRPSTPAAPPSRPDHPFPGSLACSSRTCSPQPGRRTRAAMPDGMRWQGFRCPRSCQPGNHRSWQARKSATYGHSGIPGQRASEFPGTGRKVTARPFRARPRSAWPPVPVNTLPPP